MIIFNHYYVDGILCYLVGDNVRCAECDISQHAHIVKDQLGKTVGLMVEPDEWKHAEGCSQPANFKAEPMMSPDPIVQARNESADPFQEKEKNEETTIEDEYLDPI